MSKKKPAQKGKAVRCMAKAEVTIAADWPKKVVDTLIQETKPVLTAAAVHGSRLELLVMIDDLGAYVGPGEPVPTILNGQEVLVAKVVKNLLGPIAKAPGTVVKVTELKVS
jgi:hypothetical protein